MPESPLGDEKVPEFTAESERSSAEPSKRLIGKILVNGSLAVQSKHFNQYLPLGKPRIIAAYLDQWGVDEILIVDRCARGADTHIDPALIASVVETCRAPLTVGGGIKKVEHALALVKAGADRVAINSGAIDHPLLMKQLANTLGEQAVVALVDVMQVAGEYRVYDYRENKILGTNVVDWCEQLQGYGVGEFVINAVNRDGEGKGYELPVYQKLRDVLKVPLIASGGYGEPKHISDVLHRGVDGVAIGNSLHYSEHSMSTIKAKLARQDIRQAGIAYESEQIGHFGRLLKLDDETLAHMLYQKREKCWL
ncbi:MAG: hypothetical protein COA42_10705 [Alteromonadaceae bacterium]|nr:MAG: hypothetical protein COA42_10705 [Alteromonadaceae bacterium]